MTTDVKLLPLPEWAACDETVADMSTTDVREAMTDYARANMAELLAENGRLAGALRLIAAPQRPDGTWNRDREACQQIARAALDQGNKDES